MKLIKIRYVFLTLIVLALGIAVMLYFVGGLQVSALKDNNLAFDEKEFIVDMEYLQKYDRKIKFGSDISDDVINSILEDINANKNYSAEITEYYGQKAIYINFGVGNNEDSIELEYYQVKNLIAKKVTNFDSDFAFEATTTNNNDYKISLLSSEANENKTIIVNLLKQDPKVEGLDARDEWTVTTNGTEIFIKYPTNARDKSDLVNKLNNKAEAIVKTEFIKNVTFINSIFENEKIVAQNDKYTLYFNEDTAGVTIGVNDTAELVMVMENGKAVPSVDENGYQQYKNFKTLYRTSDTQSGNDPAVGNDALVIYHFGENGQVSATGYGTFKNSVQYYDLVQKKNTRHYSINYNVENGFEILFDIGSFTNINSFFPLEIDRDIFDDYVRGNFWINQAGDANTNPIKDPVTGKYQLYYRDSGYTNSAECAAYLEENGLAVATEQFSNLDPTKSIGYWVLTNVLYTQEDVDNGLAEQEDIGSPKAKLGVDYNTADPTASPCTSNPFLSNREFDVIYSEQAFSLQYNEETGKTNNRHLEYTPESPLSYKSAVSKTGANIKNAIYDYLYNVSNDNYFRYKMYLDDKKPENIIYYKGEPVIRGGIHARDENGNFMYDEEGKPVRAAFPLDVVEQQNEKYGNADLAKNNVFRVGLRYTLTENGFEATILENSIIEGRKPVGDKDIYAHDSKLAYIDIFPNFTVNNSKTSEGQIIIPDGSGAIISFNSQKDAQDVNSFSSKPIYGLDQAFNLRKNPGDAEKIMFGMYGFLDFTDKKGIVAIADQGAAQTQITADFKREAVTTSTNYAYFITNLREKEVVYAGAATSTQTPFTKWTRDRSHIDLKYKYNFIEPKDTDEDGETPFTYVDVANVYRNYLTNKYNLELNDKTQKNVTNLNFLGAFDKRTLKLGFVYNKDFSLTTFKQAQAIIEELQSYGVDQYNISYRSWTDDGMKPQATSKAKISDVLGGKGDFLDFVEFLSENQITLYPETNVSSNYGYDYIYGNQKYTAKSVGGTYAQHWPYVIPTGLPDKTMDNINMISPKFYDSLINKFMKSYLNLDVQGTYLSDLGNMRMGDYAKKSNIFAAAGTIYQKNALELAKSKVNNVMLSEPFDYALPYATTVVNVPVESTLLPIFDYSIPLYQLVVSGIVDYATTAVNYQAEQSSNWYLLKALETGSNLNFVLSYEDTNILLDTDYTEYYNAYYINWKNKIINMNNEINKAGIHKGILDNHEYIADDVVKVHYNDGTDQGITLLINFSNSTYVDPTTGLAIVANGYMKVDGGR